MILGFRKARSEPFSVWGTYFLVLPRLDSQSQYAVVFFFFDSVVIHGYTTYGCMLLDGDWHLYKISVHHKSISNHAVYYAVFGILARFVEKFC